MKIGESMSSAIRPRDPAPLMPSPAGPSCREPDALHELGPVLPSRMDVYAKARELHNLAAIAVDCAIAGPGCDLRRALRQFDRMRALLGDGGE